MSFLLLNRLDLDQGAFSPPSHDDSFLYIPYPRKSRDEGRPQKNENLISAEIPDPSKHTAPCRAFIVGDNTTTVPTKQFKSNGIDDGFKGKAAACGTSIVQVAHQMISEKRQKDEPEKQKVDFPAGFNANVRRGSKSLPASPIASPSSSPKAHRKLFSGNQNKYFTAAFENGEKNGSWILAGLLGKRDPLSRSVSTVAEETGSTTDLSSFAAANDEDLIGNKKPTKQVFKAKPSELREMNFWSPTSM